MFLTLAIGTRHPSLLGPGEPKHVSLTIDNPHMLILGDIGSGKTTMCQHITSANPSTHFVYLGRDERHRGGAYRFDDVATEDFVPAIHPPMESDERVWRVMDALHEAASRTSSGSVLILEEMRIFLDADRNEFYRVVGELTEAGVHIVFTNQLNLTEADLRRLAVGNIALMGRLGSMYQVYGVTAARKIGISPNMNRAPYTPLARLYPELVNADYPVRKIGEFSLHTTNRQRVSTGNRVPAPARRNP